MILRGPTRPPGRFSDLRLRVLSGLAVGAVALLVVWLGGIWIALLAAVVALGMVLELRSIVAQRGDPARADVAPYALAAAAGVLLAHFAEPRAGALALVGLAAVGAAFDLARRRRPEACWSAVGTLYIGAAAIGFVALRGFGPFGFLSILWAVLIVVAADIGGYFAGRTIGGPKLWRAVSPNKTWAGLGGGIVLAALVGAAFSAATTGTYYYQVCAVSALAAVLAQAGDLGESALKRRFGVKDAGTLIPGHGGLLDRLDGHMAAIIVAAAITFTREQAVFVW